MQMHQACGQCFLYSWSLQASRSVNSVFSALLQNSALFSSDILHGHSLPLWSGQASRACSLYWVAAYRDRILHDVSGMAFTDSSICATHGARTFCRWHAESREALGLTWR